jgi:hypothetical protein
MAAQVIQGRGGCERVVALCVRLLRTRLCRHPAPRLRPRGFDSRTAPRTPLGTLRLYGARETAGFISGAGSALSLSLSLSLSLPLPPSLPLARSLACSLARRQVLELKWNSFGMKWFLIIEGWYTLVLVAFEVYVLQYSIM